MRRADSPPRTRHLASTCMFEAKGEGIMSWFEDDNFILDDDLAPDFEVPFLFMDLDALATQLSKIKLSQRLFVEKDLFPEDLDVASEEEDNEIPIQCDATLETDAKNSSVQHNLKDIKHGKGTHDHASNIHSKDQMKTDRLECFPEEVATASPKISANTEQDRGDTGFTDTVPSKGQSKQSKLEMVAPEEELEMLLNSLDGTHLSGSSIDGSFGNKSTSKGAKINESNEKLTSSTASESLALSPLDDDLDALLSLPVQNEGFAASSSTSRPAFDSDSSTDFRYAKQIDVTIDDSVDDLLADTSFCLNDQKQTTHVHGQQNISNVKVPPHSGSSHATDDFDSWFDSLQK
ncbi:unnamed protein product [Alopecurus aequalis]